MIKICRHIFMLNLVLPGVVQAGTLATTPTPRPEKGGWLEQHAALCTQVKTQQFDLVFIGDSITARFQLDHRCGISTTPSGKS